MKTKKQFTSVFLAILLSFAAFCALFCRINNTTETASAHTDAASNKTLCYIADDMNMSLSEEDVMDLMWQLEAENFTIRYIDDLESHSNDILMIIASGDFDAFFGLGTCVAESDFFQTSKPKDTIFLFEIVHYNGSLFEYSILPYLEEQGCKTMLISNYNDYTQGATVSVQNAAYSSFVEEFADTVESLKDWNEGIAIMLDRRFIEADSFNSFYEAYQASWFLRGLAEYLRGYLRYEKEYGDNADELSPLEIFRQFDTLKLYVYMGDDNIQELLVGGYYGQLLKIQNPQDFCEKAGYIYFVTYGPLLSDAYAFFKNLVHLGLEYYWDYYIDVLQIGEMKFSEDGLPVDVHNPYGIGMGEGDEKTKEQLEFEAFQSELRAALRSLLLS